MENQSNIIINILENQQIARDKQAELKKFCLGQLSKLNRLVEEKGGYITSALWDLLLYNINDLYVNENGKVCYKSFYKASKKILKFLNEYNDLIVNNLDYIMRCY